MCILAALTQTQHKVTGLVAFELPHFGIYTAIENWISSCVNGWGEGITHPEWCFLACQLATEIIGEVVAVPLQKMVRIAFVLLSHFLNSLLDMLG